MEVICVILTAWGWGTAEAGRKAAGWARQIGYLHGHPPSSCGLPRLEWGAPQGGLEGSLYFWGQG